LGIKRTKEKQETTFRIQAMKKEKKRFIGSDLRTKILNTEKEQLGEEIDDVFVLNEESKEHFRSRKTFSEKTENGNNVDDEEEDDQEEEELDDKFGIDELEQITEEDECALELFMPSEAPKRTTLADIILEKIRESQKTSA